MKRFLPLLLLIPLTGCFNLQQSEIATDGTRKDFRASGFLAGQALKGLNANSKTKETQTGLKLTSSDAASDPESINATGAIIGAAIGTALKVAK